MNWTLIYETVSGLVAYYCLFTFILLCNSLIFKHSMKMLQGMHCSDSKLRLKFLIGSLTTRPQIYVLQTRFNFIEKKTWLTHQSVCKQHFFGARLTKVWKLGLKPHPLHTWWWTEPYSCLKIPRISPNPRTPLWKMRQFLAGPCWQPFLHYPWFPHNVFHYLSRKLKDFY